RKLSNHQTRKLEAKKAIAKTTPGLDEQFVTGRLYACISSRPGQSGRCDGYILEGKELEFYVKKIRAKKSERKLSNHQTRKLEAKKAIAKTTPGLDEQFVTGRLYACIS
ncbi:hypothetical protein, partial [Salmonella sp. s54412]|uniref:hypothetical protein n=1 Tax=Salmonella sp. s54412 TaxID=3160128 RepID=UPI0037549CBA